MPQNDNPAEPFKKALAEATRVLADDRELTVSYSVDPPGMTGDQVRLPQVTRRLTPDEVLLARGTADAFALRHRYHDARTHARYAPTGEMARDLLEAMETARCEAMGARDMPGTAGNIDARIAIEAGRKGYDQIGKAADAPLAVAAGYLIRHLATGRPLPPGGAERHGAVARLHRDAGGRRRSRRLDASLSDQAAFARLARQDHRDLGYGDQLGDDPDAGDDDDERRTTPTRTDAESQGDEDSRPTRPRPPPSAARSRSPTRPRPRSPWTTTPTPRWAPRSSCPRARPRSSRRRPRPTATPTRTTRSSPPSSTRRSRPPSSPSRPSSTACAPISTSSSNRSRAPSRGSPTSSSAAFRRSRTAAGSSTARRASSTPAASPAWWRTRRRRSASRSRRTPSSATRW